MMNLWEHGLTNTVCTFGTSFGSSRKRAKVQALKSKLEIYKLQGVTKIIILYDGDEAGQRAARQLEKNIKDEYVVQNFILEEGLDPGNLKKFQIEALKEELYGSIS